MKYWQLLAIERNNFECEHDSDGSIPEHRGPALMRLEVGERLTNFWDLKASNVRLGRYDDSCNASHEDEHNHCGGGKPLCYWLFRPDKKLVLLLMGDKLKCLAFQILVLWDCL